MRVKSQHREDIIKEERKTVKAGMVELLMERKEQLREIKEMYI